jgi:hypothetical protein
LGSLDQNSNYLAKNEKVLMSTAGPANLYGKIWKVEYSETYE